MGITFENFIVNFITVYISVTFIFIFADGKIVIFIMVELFLVNIIVYKPIIVVFVK